MNSVLADIRQSSSSLEVASPLHTDSGIPRGADESLPSSPGNYAPKTVIEWSAEENQLSGRIDLGLEFDGHNLALVALRTKGKSSTIEQLRLVQWSTPPSGDVLADHLREWIPAGNPVVEITIGSPRGMVREFTIARVPKRRRTAAALWEGRKLIPFPLTETEALFGMEFLPAGKDEWAVTLVAVPRQDAGSLIEALTALNWPLRRISLVGTRFPQIANNHDGHVATEAIVICSHQRAAFAIFQDGKLQFHYDLGALPGLTPGSSEDDLLGMGTSGRNWASALQSAVEDALNFGLNANRALIPTRLRLVGVVEAIAPLVTDWGGGGGDRFPDGVIAVNPLNRFVEGLPEQAAEWITSQTGLLTPAVLAAAGEPAIDLTPAPIKARAQQRRWLRFARMTFVLSVITAIVLTVLMWRHVHDADRAVTGFREEIAVLQNSPAATAVSANVGILKQHQTRLNDIPKLRQQWMPWVKTVLGTLPREATLFSFDLRTAPVDPSRSPGPIVARLTGRLGAGSKPHAITYKNWLAQLRRLTENEQGKEAGGGAELVSERTTDWKGNRRSEFTIELRPVLGIFSGRTK